MLRESQKATIKEEENSFICLFKGSIIKFLYILVYVYGVDLAFLSGTK